MTLASVLSVGAPHKGRGVLCESRSPPGEGSRYPARSEESDSASAAGPVHQRGSHTAARPPQQEVCALLKYCT